MAVSFTTLGLEDPGSAIPLRPNGFEPRNITWGHPWQIGTASYWVSLTADEAARGRFTSSDQPHRLGATLKEEVAACLLGGHGMPFEMGLAAFEAVRNAGLLDHEPTAEQLEKVLRQPLIVGGRHLRYRFPVRRAIFLSEALGRITNATISPDPVEMRHWLLTIRGIGPKTAAWVVRNHLGSDEVAIIDVHVQRAGRRAGVFDPEWSVARHYDRLEAFFLAWASAGNVRPSELDAVIWGSEAASARRRAGRSKDR